MHQAEAIDTTKRFDPHNAEGELMRIEGAANALCILAATEENEDRTLGAALYYLATQIEEHCKELRKRMFPGKAVQA